MSTKNTKTVAMNIPAGLARWAKAEARRRGMNADALLVRLLKREKDGGTALEVDIIERADGSVQIDSFPDKPYAGVTVRAPSRMEAFALLQEECKQARLQSNNWRMHRAYLPGYTNVKFMRLDLDVPGMRLASSTTLLEPTGV